MTAAVTLAALGNGPTFSAYQSSAQTLTSNVTTKIQLQISLKKNNLKSDLIKWVMAQ
jgi:hypothetical protein